MSGVTPLPTPPTTTDPENFAERADAFVAALPQFVTEINTIIGQTIPAGSAAAGTLTGNTIASNVLNSSLQNLGTQNEVLVMGGFKVSNAGAATVSGDLLRFDEIASQAQVEAASSNAVLMSPGNMKYHPGIFKSWVEFDGTGTLTINASHAMSSVTDLGTGVYRPNYSVTMSINYYPFFGSVGFTGSSAYIRGADLVAQGATSMDIWSVDKTGNSLIDAAICSFGILGDI